jgi:hypothetical protein
MTKFSSNLYRDVSLDELVTYSIFILLEESKEATFENIVAKCFELFPEKFSLIGYPQWPDSARVNKSWLRCRTDFKYIKGSVKSGFTLTSKGLEVVERVQKRLKRPSSEKIIVSQKRAKERSKEEQFINELVESEVFTRYLIEQEKTEISHFEFCDMLYCTLESSAKALKENLEKLKEYAQKLNRTEALKFLLFSENKFSHLLKEKVEQKEYSGGMNKLKTKGD